MGNYLLRVHKMVLLFFGIPLMMNYYIPLPIPRGNYVSDITWSPDGQSLASASCFAGSNQPENCALVLWNPSNNEHLQTMRGDNYDFTSIAWSPTGQVIASAFMNGDVILFSPNSGKRMRTLRTPLDRLSLLGHQMDKH